VRVKSHRQWPALSPQVKSDNNGLHPAEKRGHLWGNILEPENAMPKLSPRRWVPSDTEAYVRRIAAEAAHSDSTHVIDRIEKLAQRNREIHERDCINLNPATNVMNPRAEALLAAGLGTRPSLGWPGDKYEMGLEAIEEIEVIAAELAAEIFQARFAEIRVGSGALANLYAFMATCKLGDSIVAPPATIGGHVTHHAQGAAGLYGLKIHHAPVQADGYTVDLDGLRALAHEVRPRLITIGGSLNLFAHPVEDAREIADEVGARLLFDAAHLCGMIAGRAWENPLTLGAHLMTMSTYKSLGGPAGGLIVTNEADLAARLDAIAFPGLTANFDAGRVAALAVALLDWRDHGRAYALAMIHMARALADAISQRGLKVFAARRGFTDSHQFALEAAALGGGQAAARRLRRANILTCGIGLPLPEVAGDLNGLRIGTPEIVRFGMGPEHAALIAGFVAEGLSDNMPEDLPARVSAFRRGFGEMGFVGD